MKILQVNRFLVVLCLEISLFSCYTRVNFTRPTVLGGVIAGPIYYFPASRKRKEKVKEKFLCDYQGFYSW